MVGEIRFCVITCKMWLFCIYMTILIYYMSYYVNPCKIEGSDAIWSCGLAYGAIFAFQIEFLKFWILSASQVEHGAIWSHKIFAGRAQGVFPLNFLSTSSSGEFAFSLLGDHDGMQKNN